MNRQDKYGSGLEPRSYGRRHGSDNRSFSNYHYYNYEASGYRGRSDDQYTSGPRKEFVPRKNRRPMPQVKRPPIEAMPKPEYPTKKESETKNDPLYDESIFSDFGSRMSRRADIPEIQVTASGLPYLADSIYRAAQTKSLGFSKRISAAMLGYYCAILTHARMLNVHINNYFPAATHEIEFVNQIINGKYFTPKSLARYLSGIGNTKIPNGRELLFEYPIANTRRVLAERKHYYQRVDENTHYLYASYPCPAIYAQRIQEDLRYTREWRKYRDDIDKPENIWDLPQRIRPLGWQAAVPNTNMLGWAPAKELSPTQMATCASCGIDEVKFPCTNNENTYSRDLMNHISIELLNLRYIVGTEFPTAVTGSQGALPFETSVCEEEVPIHDGIFETNCFLELPGPVQFIGSHHLYRIRRNPEIPNWSVYWTIDGFNEVPMPWRDTVNHLLESDYSEISESRLRGESFDPQVFTEQIVKKDNMVGD